MLAASSLCHFSEQAHSQSQVHYIHQDSDTPSLSLMSCGFWVFLQVVLGPDANWLYLLIFCGPSTFCCRKYSHNAHLLSQAIKNLNFHDISIPPPAPDSDTHPYYVCTRVKIIIRSNAASVTTTILAKFSLLLSPFGSLKLFCFCCFFFPLKSSCKRYIVGCFQK